MLHNQTAAPAEKSNQRIRPLLEISFVIFCTLVAEWAILPLFGRSFLIGSIPVFIAFAFMFLSHRAHRETARDIGFRADNFPKALALLAVPMLATTLFLYALCWLMWRPTPIRLSLVGWQILLTLFWLFLWGLLQQYALQGFINRRAQMFWGKGWQSILFVALVFALLHLPNLPLALATFAGGLLWAAVYQRAPNLYALALSHCLMTVALISTIPNELLHGMRVGFNYFR